MTSRSMPALAGLTVLIVVPLAAQVTPESLPAPTRATQPPLSGRSK